MRTFLVAMLALGGAGCSGHYLQTMAPVHALARGGDPQAAYDELVKQTDGTGWDELLVALDKGALLHRAGKWQESADWLNRAIDLGDNRETVSVGEETFGKAPFRMAKHEKQALHAMQAVNYLMLDKRDDAVVEARRTDLRQVALEQGRELSASDEKFVTGSVVDEKQRAFFEQLVFGRYISALARERGGDLDGAFIDYYRAFTIKRGAPLDARIDIDHLAPRLLALAEALKRPELDELRRWYPNVTPEALGNDGEVVMLVEAGFAAVPVLNQERQSYMMVPVPRSDAPMFATTSAGPVVPQTVSSLDELTQRRGYRGLLVDRERSASVGINTVMFVGYFLLWPVAMPLLIKRGYESGIRGGQAWAMLPAEFAVARVKLPPGKHTVQVPTVKGLVDREVEVVRGKPTFLVVEGP